MLNETMRMNTDHANPVHEVCPHCKHALYAVRGVRGTCLEHGEVVAVRSAIVNPTIPSHQEGLCHEAE